MSKIRHIAIKADDPGKLATFYEETFDMKVLKRSERGAIYMTDGYMNLALLPVRENQKAGIEHFGFHVDSVDAIESRLEAAGRPRPKIRPNNPPYAEKRTVDPEGNQIDLSQHGFQEEEYQEDRAAETGKVKAPA